MTDYNPIIDFSVKDALLTADPDKLIKGAELDPELDSIALHMATKYDSTDIASQAQAEAGVSNTVLMTPLRVANLLVGDGGGAGIIADLVDLVDPGDDRIIFWNESSDEATFLDIGSHLEITAGNVLNVTEATIDHDALVNFVTDEHVLHASVSMIAGEGLTGGGTLEASRTFDLDINNLTLETTLAVATDLFVFWDASASEHKQAPLENIIGESLGDCHVYRNGNQALSAATPATVVYNAQAYDSLERGTISLSTGEYTVGASAARVWVHATVTINQFTDDENIVLEIQRDGTTWHRTEFFNDTDNDTPTQTIQVSGNISCTAGQVIRVRATTSDAETILGTSLAYSTFSIVELA